MLLIYKSCERSSADFIAIGMNASTCFKDDLVAANYHLLCVLAFSDVKVQSLCCRTIVTRILLLLCMPTA